MTVKISGRDFYPTPSKKERSFSYTNPKLLPSNLNTGKK